jgi:hypothetical protein
MVNQKLFFAAYFAVSQIRAVAPRITIHHSDPSMDSSIKIVLHLEQVFETYRVMFKELKGDIKKKKQRPIPVFLQRKEKL